MALNTVENYLKYLNEIYHTGGGVAEESSYGPPGQFLNKIAWKLKSHVHDSARIAVSPADPMP